jgi:hypothetical protein
MLETQINSSEEEEQKTPQPASKKRKVQKTPDNKTLNQDLTKTGLRDALDKLQRETALKTILRFIVTCQMSSLDQASMLDFPELLEIVDTIQILKDDYESQIQSGLLEDAQTWWKQHDEMLLSIMESLPIKVLLNFKLQLTMSKKPELQNLNSLATANNTSMPPTTVYDQMGYVGASADPFLNDDQVRSIVTAEQEKMLSEQSCCINFKMGSTRHTIKAVALHTTPDFRITLNIVDMKQVFFKFLNK